MGRVEVYAPQPRFATSLNTNSITSPFFVALFSHLPVLWMLPAFVEGLRNVTLVFICAMGKGQQQEFCKGTLDHGLNKTAPGLGAGYKRNKPERLIGVSLLLISTGVLRQVTQAVFTSTCTLQKISCYQKNDKSSAFLQITLDICCAYEINYL